MPTRDFPFSPRNTRQLEAGDLVAVPCEPQGWACLQVVELKRKGPGSLKSLIVGPLPWFGEAPPTDQDAEGVPVTEQGLTGIELFTESGLQVVANSPVASSGLPSNYRDLDVGTVHHVWGWKTAIRRARAAAEAAKANSGDGQI